MRQDLLGLTHRVFRPMPILPYSPTVRTANLNPIRHTAMVTIIRGQSVQSIFTIPLDKYTDSCYTYNMKLSVSVNPKVWDCAVIVKDNQNTLVNNGKAIRSVENSPNNG
jgi:hypothetical protein